MRYDLDDLELPQVSSQDACRAADISADTLKNWVIRKPYAVFLTDAERMEAGSRTLLKFSVRRVYQLAITAELVAAGQVSRRAAMLAAGFTDSIGGSSINPHAGRTMGELYKDGWTYLVASKNRQTGSVECVTEDAEFLSVLARHDDGPVIVLRLNPIIERVRARLSQMTPASTAAREKVDA